MVRYSVMSLGTFPGRARYTPIDRLVYPLMVNVRTGGGAMLYAPFSLFKS